MALSFDWEKFNESQIRSVLVKKIENAGNLEIESVEAPNKQKREAGIPVKEAEIVFKSGQKLKIKVRPGNTIGGKVMGDLFQIFLNGEKVPLTTKGQLPKNVIAEISDIVSSNEEKFLKNQEKKQARALKPKPELPAKTPLNNQVEQKQSEVSEIRAGNAEINTKIKLESDDLTEKQKVLSGLQTEYGQEQKTNKELTAELTALQNEGE